MPIVRERDLKQVKRDLKKIETKLKDVDQEIKQLSENISEAEDTIVELSVQKEENLEAHTKKSKEQSDLQTQYLELKQKLEYMTGNEEQFKPWDKDRPSSERSLFAFAEGSA